MSAPLIIEHPEWQTFRQRTLYALITLAFWVLWAYLWQPLLDFFGWAVGLSAYRQAGTPQEDYLGLLHLFGIYTLVIAVLGGSLVLWALYNYLRFRGADRRRPRPAVNAADQGLHYTLDPDELRGWQQERRLVIHHDEHSNVIGVDCDESNWRRESPEPGPPRRMPWRFLPERRAA